MFEVKASVRVPRVPGYFKSTFSLRYDIHCLTDELVMEAEIVDANSQEMGLLRDLMNAKDPFKVPKALVNPIKTGRNSNKSFWEEGASRL